MERETGLPRFTDGSRVEGVSRFHLESELVGSEIGITILSRWVLARRPADTDPIKTNFVLICEKSKFRRVSHANLMNFSVWTCVQKFLISIVGIRGVKYKAKYDSAGLCNGDRYFFESGELTLVRGLER